MNYRKSRSATGDLGYLAEFQKIGRRSQHDELMPSMIVLMENLGSLVQDVEFLAKAAVEGRLSKRAGVRKHQGEFRNVVQGVNDTLDALQSANRCRSH